MGNVGPFWLGACLGGLGVLALGLLVKRARRASPRTGTRVARDFLASQVVAGTCEWVDAASTSVREREAGYRPVLHPTLRTPCIATFDDGEKTLMIRPEAAIVGLGAGTNEVYKELLQGARTGSVLRFTMLTVFLTATGALLSAYAGSPAAFPRPLVAGAGLMLAAVFATLEMVLSYNMSVQNEMARAMAMPLHGDIFVHRRPALLWLVRIAVIGLLVAVGAFWATALVAPQTVMPSGC